MEEKLKELDKRVRELEIEDKCEYSILVNNEYIQVPIKLFMKGIMDDKNELIKQNNELKNSNNKLEKVNNAMSNVILDLINKLNKNDQKKEEVELI